MLNVLNNRKLPEMIDKHFIFRFHSAKKGVSSKNMRLTVRVTEKREFSKTNKQKKGKNEMSKKCLS